MSLVSRRSPPSRIFMRFLPLLLAALVALAAMPDSAHAQRPVVKLPTVVASGWNEGAESPLPSSEDDLRGLERSLRQQFAQKDAPDELLTLVRTSASDLILVPWVEPRDVRGHIPLRRAGGVAAVYRLDHRAILLAVLEP